jgi:hypothetical protein
LITEIFIGILLNVFDEPILTKLSNMKMTLFLLAFVALAKFGYGQQVTAAAKSDYAVFEWVEQTHDFGKIKQGTPVTFEFKFTNKGKVPIVLTDARPSCGCTTPDWTKQPVPPGQQGYVKATFNAANVGGFNKTITVTANVEQGTVPLVIKGEVLAPIQ